MSKEVVSKKARMPHVIQTCKVLYHTKYIIYIIFQTIRRQYKAFALNCK